MLDLHVAIVAEIAVRIVGTKPDRTVGNDRPLVGDSDWRLDIAGLNATRRARRQYCA